MRHSNRWLRGKLGGCHLLMLLLKVVFFFFFFFFIYFFSPWLCKAPPSIRLWRRGCSAVPSGRAGTGWDGGDRGDSGAPGAPGSKKPVGFACCCSLGGVGMERGVSASHRDVLAGPALLLAKGQ